MVKLHRFLIAGALLPESRIARVLSEALKTQCYGTSNNKQALCFSIIPGFRRFAPLFWRAPRTSGSGKNPECYDASMQRAGFILTGGRSSRMGKDKALLRWRNVTVVEHLACLVQRAAGSVALIGNPDRYRSLGLSCYRDLRPGLGPLAGLETALTVTSAEWNMIVACDLPHVAPAWLETLFDRAEAIGLSAVAIRDAAGRIQPLCGVYHRDCLPAVTAALDGQELRMMRLMEKLNPLYVDIAEALPNINTPEDWEAVRPD
jgi:molybdenum cofactor guanylyltransferase